jgi:hypothetical protein
MGNKSGSSKENRKIEEVKQLAKGLAEGNVKEESKNDDESHPNTNSYLS